MRLKLSPQPSQDAGIKDIASDDSANKEYHKIIELTNQNDGGQEAEL